MTTKPLNWAFGDLRAAPDRGWCLPAEDLARPAVQLLLDVVQVLRGEDR
jgi:hypothetical protein